MVKLQGSAQDLAELAAAECEGCWAMPSLGSEGWPAAPESSSVDDEILLFFSHERRLHFDCAEKSTKTEYFHSNFHWGLLWRACKCHRESQH